MRELLQNDNFQRIEVWLKDKKQQARYHTSFVNPGPNLWRVEIPGRRKVGQIVHSGGQTRATLDVGQLELYAYGAKGDEKTRKKLQKAMDKHDMDYQYTEVYQLPDENNDAPDVARHVMTLHRLAINSKKGREVEVAYIYFADQGYVDEEEFKVRSKELNAHRSGNMSIKELEDYAAAHKIPVLTATERRAINALGKKR